MSEFLSGKQLAEKIQQVTSGDNVKCAVAFWGEGTPQRLGVNGNWQIICDLTMGGTSAVALEYMHQVCAGNLKHHPYLHAKVYLSNQGVVIGSANASFNALGDQVKDPKLTEVAVFHDIDSPIWNDAQEWFEGLFDKANVIGDVETKRAHKNYRRPNFERRYDYEKMALLDFIVEHPERFSDAGFSFLIARESVNPNDREKMADESVKAALKADPGLIAEKNANLKKELANWDVARTFQEWPIDETQKLAPHVFEFYIGPKGGNAQVVLHTKDSARYFEVAEHEGEKLANFYTTVIDGVALERLKGAFSTARVDLFETRRMSLDEKMLILKISRDLEKDTDRKCRNYGIFNAQDFAERIVQARKK